MGKEGGKGKKKKWSKGRVRDKLNNAVLLDQERADRFLGEVAKWKLITPAIVSERLKVSGSIARQGLQALEKQGLIRCVDKHSMCKIYTRSIKADEADEGIKVIPAGKAKSAAASKKEEEEDNE